MNGKMSFELFTAFYRQIHLAVNERDMDLETATALVWAVTAGEGEVTTASILTEVRALMNPHARHIAPIAELEVIFVDVAGQRVAEFVDLRAPDNWSPEQLPGHVIQQFVASVKTAMANHGGQLSQLPPSMVKASGQGAIAMLEQSMREHLIGDGDRLVDEFRAEMDRIFGTYEKGGGES